MKVTVYQADGSESGKSVTLDKSVFGVEPNDHAIWLDVRRIQASSHQGTHKAKERSDVAGSTRKLYRQKGTGFARAGSAKSPIRRSGGTIFGPKPHGYGIKVNRKTQLVARRSVLTYKAREKAVRVVEDFSFDAPSTADLRRFLSSMEIADKKVLLLTEANESALHLSGRNLKKFTVRRAEDASTLDLIHAQVVIFYKTALKSLSKRLKGATDTKKKA